MRSNARTRRPDVGRIRESVSGPGIDTRSWIAAARIDDDPDAIQFLPGFGWVADVTFHSGALMGEGPVPCRVLSAFGSPNEGTSCPVSRGAEVLVAITDGDLGVQPVILGYLHNPTTDPLPTSVNGQPVNEGTAETTVFAKTNEGLNAEFGGPVRVSSSVKLSAEAPQVALADENATQSFIRGNDFQTASNAFTAAIGTFAAGLVPPPPPAVLGALNTAIAAYNLAVAAALSTRVRGE